MLSTTFVCIPFLSRALAVDPAFPQYSPGTWTLKPRLTRFLLVISSFVLGAINTYGNVVGV
jgi:hypothetical protein